MKKLIIILLVLMVWCKTAKVVKGDYAFYIKDWRCNKDDNFLLRLHSVSSNTSFWVMELNKDGTPKKCGNCEEYDNYK